MKLLGNRPSSTKQREEGTIALTGNQKSLGGGWGFCLPLSLVPLEIRGNTLCRGLNYCRVAISSRRDKKVPRLGGECLKPNGGDAKQIVNRKSSSREVMKSRKTKEGGCRVRWSRCLMRNRGEERRVAMDKERERERKKGWNHLAPPTDLRQLDDNVTLGTYISSGAVKNKTFLPPSVPWYFKQEYSAAVKSGKGRIKFHCVSFRLVSILAKR